MQRNHLGRDWAAYSFSLSVDSDGAVIGPEGVSGVTHAIPGLKTGHVIGRWQVFADAANAHGLKYKNGADGFAEADGDACANYLTLAADQGDNDEDFSEAARNQTLRVASAGEGDVTVYGKVWARVDLGGR